MRELTEISFAGDCVILENHLVKSAILPRVAAELNRDVVVKSNCVVEGAVYGRNLRVETGPARVCGAVYTQVELHVNSDAAGEVVFERSVGSAGAVVSHANGCQLQFLADVHAGAVRLRNAYVGASVFADDIVLEDCVVAGGVFGSRSVEMTNCLVGTFYAPSVRICGTNYLLLPAGYSVEPLQALPSTRLFSLALADLGALIRGVPESPSTGKVPIVVDEDEQRAVLTDADNQQVMRSYSVAGKVLAADMLDLDKLQNHFILTAAALGPQLLRTYDLGRGANGKAVELTADRISGFLNDILHGRLAISDLSGTFKLSDFMESPVAAAAAVA